MFEKIIGKFYEMRTPTVSFEYIKKHDCSYSANNSMYDKYVYYWEGDFKTGREVKVRAEEILRHRVQELEFEVFLYQHGMKESEA